MTQHSKNKLCRFDQVEPPPLTWGEKAIFILPILYIALMGAAVILTIKPKWELLW